MRYTEGQHLGCYKDLDIPKQWENESYGNDTMASFKHKNTRIWIDYPNKKDREDKELNPYRFHVEVFQSEDWGVQDEPIGKEYNTDSFKDVLEDLKRLFKVDSYELLDYIDFSKIRKDFNIHSINIDDHDMDQLQKDLKNLIIKNITK